VGVVSVAVAAARIVGIVILSRVFAPTESRPGADGGVAPSVQPFPTPADAPPTGEDIGLGFPVCNVTSVAGVFASGVDGTAWVATKTGDVGCPSLGDGMQVVALDVSGTAWPTPRSGRSRATRGAPRSRRPMSTAIGPTSC
jgi:hypothetical protein